MRKCCKKFLKISRRCSHHANLKMYLFFTSIDTARNLKNKFFNLQNNINILAAKNTHENFPPLFPEIIKCFAIIAKDLLKKVGVVLLKAMYCIYLARRIYTAGNIHTLRLTKAYIYNRGCQGVKMDYKS